MIEEKVWEGGSMLAAGLAGLAAHQLLKVVWRESQGEEPPENPAASGVTWPAALGWAVASGVAIGLAHVLTRRGATAAFRAMSGGDPPHV
ncbi:MAG TPA: DUF4235 domain-containing protein [Longimicrobiales bacterium]|nr:DUF4235 domain-containing protein [Longimicrobiales bacterium]